MSDKFIYDEIDDHPQSPSFRWEYVNGNHIPVPEYVDDDQLPPPVVDEDDDEIPEGN